MPLILFAVRTGTILFWVFYRFAYAAGGADSTSVTFCSGLWMFIKEFFKIESKDKRFDDILKYFQGEDDKMKNALSSRN